MPEELKQGAAAGSKVEVEEKGLLDQLVQEGRFARDAAAAERGKDLADELLKSTTCFPYS